LNQKNIRKTKLVDDEKQEKDDIGYNEGKKKKKKKRKRRENILIIMRYAWNT